MPQGLVETILDSPEIYHLPNYQTDQIAWQGHIPFAFWLIKSLQPKSFVELGSYKGDSYFAFCQAIKSLKLDSRTFAIDSWQGDEHTGAYSSQVYDQVVAHNNEHYSHFSNLLRMTFDDALPTFDEDSIDLLHIDGLHTYDAVRHDFDTWFPKLSSSAIVLFHDIAVEDRGFGVWKLWEELKIEYPSFDFPHSNGLGVLFVGNSLPDIFNKMGTSDVAERQAIQNLFAALGDRILKVAQIEYWKAQKDELYWELEKANRPKKFWRKN